MRPCWAARIEPKHHRPRAAIPQVARGPGTHVPDAFTSSIPHVLAAPRPSAFAFSASQHFQLAALPDTEVLLFPTLRKNRTFVAIFHLEVDIFRTFVAI